jgi:hypothetical protein
MLMHDDDLVERLGRFAEERVEDIETAWRSFQSRGRMKGRKAGAEGS